MTKHKTESPEQLRAQLLFCIGAAIIVVTFAFNVRRHWFLADDAFISFHYARNLVEGHGLVWNVGEPPVEGYTNFLWMLLMAAGLALGIPPESFSPVLGVACGAGVLVAVTAFARSRLGAWSLFALFPAALLATNRSFTGWCTGGLETQLFTLLVFLALMAFVREHDQCSEVPVASAALFALAALTRPEGLLFAAPAALLMAVAVARGKRSPRSLVCWIAPLVLVVGTHFFWRRWYYGFWFPNTFYAKVSGFWWEQAAKYLLLFGHDYSLQWFLSFVVLYALFKRDTAYWIAVLVFVVHTVGILYVGGDIFDFRFMVPILPLFYWVVGEACHHLYNAAREKSRPLHLAAALTPCALVALSLLWHGAPQPPTIRYGVETLSWTRDYGQYRTREGKWLRQLVERGVLPADLRYATGAAGASPYFSRLYTVDTLGLNDSRIAHQPIERRGYIAHEKKASRDYLREKQIAVIDTAQGVVYEIPPPEIVVGNPPVYCRLPYKCARFDQGYLVFETALTDEELHRVLGHLEFLPAPPTPK